MRRGDDRGGALGREHADHARDDLRAGDDRGGGVRDLVAREGRCTRRDAEADEPPGSPARTRQRSQLSGLSGVAPLRTSKWSTGPFNDPVSPEWPITVPGATSLPVETLTSFRC